MDLRLDGKRVVPTAGAAGIGRVKVKARGVSFEARYEEYTATASMRRMISPQDIANICSDAGRLVSARSSGSTATSKTCAS